MHSSREVRQYRFLAPICVLLVLVPPGLASPAENINDGARGPGPGARDVTDDVTLGPGPEDLSAILPWSSSPQRPSAVLGPRAPDPSPRVVSNVPWPMFGKDAQHTGNAGLFARKLTEPMLNWSTPYSIESNGMAVGNFTGNIHLVNQTQSYDRPTLHVVFADNGLVEIAEAATGRAMWQAPLGGALLGAPALSDFSGDNRLELVVTSSSGNISCYAPVIEWNGTAYSWTNTNLSVQKVWDRSLGAEAGYSSPVLGDVSGDGNDDVVLCAGHTLYVLNGLNGSVVWMASLPGNIATSPVLAKYGTGGLWVAAQSFNTSILALDRTYLTLFNDRGVESWTKSVALSTFPTAVIALPSPAAADLDRDNFVEILFVSPFESGNGRLHAYNQDGSTVWSSVQVRGQCEASPAVGDINGDSVIEVVVASWNFTALASNARVNLMAVDGMNGTEEWSRTVDNVPVELPPIYAERSAAAPALADLDRDGRVDVVAALYNGGILGLNGSTGDELWSYNSSRASLTSSPAVADGKREGFPMVFADGLALIQRIADLAITSSDISLSSDSPAEDDAVSMTAFIYNNGTKSQGNVTVLFEDIYDNVTVWTAEKNISVAAGGGSAGATVSWTAQGGGSHRILVTADPYGQIEETSEENNRASRDIAVFSRYTVGVSCAANESYIDAGQEAAYLVIVKNLGDAPNTVNVSAGAVPAGWMVDLSPGSLQLAAGQGSTVTVRIRSPSDAPAAPYPVNVTARSDTASANRATVVLTTHVRAQYGVAISPRFSSLNTMADDWASYLFNVTNTGKDDDTILFGNSTPPRDWVVILSHASVDLPGRSQMMLTMLVKAPPTAGEGELAGIDLTVRSSGDASKSEVASTQTRVVLPDLTVSSVRFFRADGVEADGTRIHLVENGSAVINVTVQNLRDNVDVGGVRVQVLEGEVSLGEIIIPRLYLGQEASAEVEWRPTEGMHALLAVVDPAPNRVRESNEDNNNLTAYVSVIGRFATAPYPVTGTVSKPGGSPVIGGTVVMSNLRTGQNLSTGTDGAGRYSGDINTIPGGYQEEERVMVTASDGMTTCSTVILAYSEDGGKKVDLVLQPGPHDFHFALNRTAVNTDPLEPASYKLWFTNLGNNWNTIAAEKPAMPAQWDFSRHNSTGVATNLVTLAPGAADYLVFDFTPPATARAGSRADIRIQATSLNDSAVRRFADTVTTVNQVFGVELTVEKGPLLKLGETARCNFTVRNAGNGNDTFDLSASSPEGLEAQLNRSTFELGAFSSASTFLTATASEGIAPGAYNISIQARSRYSPSGLTGRANLSVTVEAFRHLPRLSGGIGALQQEEYGSVGFNLTNAGNVQDGYRIGVRAVSPEDLPADWYNSTWRNGIQTSSATLEPGETARFELRVDAPLEIGNISAVTFNVSATSLTDTTQVAYNTLILSIERPDLVFDGGVRLSSLEPKDGQNVTIKVTVLNQGTWDSPPVLVRFSQDQKVIGEVTTPEIPMGGKEELQMSWTAVPGSHAIKAELNPESGKVPRVKELRYYNNDVTQNVNVAAAGWDISWGLIAGFAVAMVVVVGLFMWASRKGRRKARGRRPADSDEEEGEEEEEEDGEGGEEDEEGAEEAEGEEEEEETSVREGEEETEEEIAAGGDGEEAGEEAGEAGQEAAAGEEEATVVEAVEVVEEEAPPITKPMRKKPPHGKGNVKRPPAEQKEVEMPPLMRIG